MRLIILTQLEYLLRIVAAALCGGVIGYERTSRMKTAGIRTYFVVATASALMVLVSKYGFSDVVVLDSVSLDPSRMAAGVVTAVGFLGVGVIYVRKQSVSGVTTAAGIWATVGVGCALGAGMYFIGVVTSLLIVGVQVILHRERLVKESACGTVVLRTGRWSEVEALVASTFEAQKIEIAGITARKLEGGAVEVTLVIHYPETYRSTNLVHLLQDIPEICCVEA